MDHTLKPSEAVGIDDRKEMSDEILAKACQMEVASLPSHWEHTPYCLHTQCCSGPRSLALIPVYPRASLLH